MNDQNETVDRKSVGVQDLSEEEMRSTMGGFGEAGALVEPTLVPERIAAGQESADFSEIFRIVRKKSVRRAFHL